MSYLTNLPEDVLINKILLKSDTNSLVNLRCVCKNFRSLITNPDFVKMHCHDQFNNNNNSLVIVYLKSNLFCSLSFNDIDIKQSRPENVEISTPFKLPWFMGSCNGLLCIVDKVDIDQNPCLWNPSTKEYKKLPPPLPALAPPLVEDPALLSHYFTYGFGYDRIIDDYKVIQCENFSFRHNPITKFQVYTLGTDTWRMIDSNPYESDYMMHYRYHSSGMFVNGAVHWFGYLNRKSRIIAFDIEKEMFRAELPLRSRLISHPANMCSLNVLRGCLCIYEARIKREFDNWVQMDVWMMKEYGVKDSWTRLFNIKDGYAFQYPSMFDFKVLKFCESGEFLVSMKPRDHKVLILYDPINKKSIKVEFGKITSFEGCMEIHIQSLVSLKTGIYMGRVKKQVLERKTEDEYVSEKKRRQHLNEEKIHLKTKNKNMHVLRGCLCIYKVHRRWISVYRCLDDERLLCICIPLSKKS